MPVHTIGTQLREAVLLHRDVTRKEAHDLALDALALWVIAGGSWRRLGWLLWFPLIPFELAAGQLKITGFWDEVRVLAIAEEDVARLADPAVVTKLKHQYEDKEQTD